MIKLSKINSKTFLHNVYWIIKQITAQRRQTATEISIEIKMCHTYSPHDGTAQQSFLCMTDKAHKISPASQCAYYPPYLP